jgi:hypothetical protein
MTSARKEAPGSLMESMESYIAGMGALYDALHDTEAPATPAGEKAS